MWNTVLFVVVISVCWRLIAGILVGMCENKTLSSSSILLQRNDRNSPTNCWCTIISETGRSTKVIFNVFSIIGQQYKLSFSNGTSTSYVENRMSPDIFFTIRGSADIKIELEENDCSLKDGLEFGIDINSNSADINITCHKPTVSTLELCTQTTSSEVTTSRTVTTKPLLVTVPTVPNTASSSVEISSTEKVSEGSTNSQNDKTTNNTAMGDLVAGLIGGLVSCMIVVIVLVIVIVCIVRRQQQKEAFYSHPSTVRPPPNDGYTDLNFTPSRQQPVV